MLPLLRLDCPVTANKHWRLSVPQPQQRHFGLSLLSAVLVKRESASGQRCHAITLVFTGNYAHRGPGFTPGITGQEAGIQPPLLTLFIVLSADCAREEGVLDTRITCKRQLEEPQARIWTQGWLCWPPCCHNNRWCGIIIKKWVNNLWPRDARLCFMRDTDTDLDLEAIKKSIAACHNLNFLYKTFLHVKWYKNGMY